MKGGIVMGGQNNGTLKLHLFGTGKKEKLRGLIEAVWQRSIRITLKLIHQSLSNINSNCYLGKKRYI